MSRGLTLEQIEVLALESTKLKLLVEIIHNGLEWRFCTGKIGAKLGGDLYLSRGLRMSASSSGKLDGIHMTVEIDNRDDLLSSELAISGGLAGAIATVTLLTTIDGISKEPITIMRGDVTRCLIADNLKIEVGPLNRGQKQSGLLKCSRMCPYIYNGDLCDVAPTDFASYPECRRTLEDCTERNNEERFGGFIWALDAGESIMVEAAPVKVEESSASNSGDGFLDCHSGRFVTILHADGTKERVEMRCDIEGMNEGGDHTDGYYTDPWELVIDDLTEAQEES